MKHANDEPGGGRPRALEIPDPLRIDEAEIHQALALATRSGGQTARAARALSKLLLRHLAWEKEDVLQPLGALWPVVHHDPLPDEAGLLAKLDRLKANVPRLVRQHDAIVKAIQRLQARARAEGKLEAVGFTHRLLLRAWMDDVVFFPAVLLLGECLRLRAQQTSRRPG